jgi:hypothetical protein
MKAAAVGAAVSSAPGCRWGLQSRAAGCRGCGSRSRVSGGGCCLLRSRVSGGGGCSLSCSLGIGEPGASRPWLRLRLQASGPRAWLQKREKKKTEEQLTRNNTARKKYAYCFDPKLHYILPITLTSF